MRQLVITEHEGYVTITNSDAKKVQARTVEGALVTFASKYGVIWEQGDIHSGYEAAAAIDKMLGDRERQGQIHSGVLST